jgi:phage terminase large subunit
MADPAREGYKPSRWGEVYHSVGSDVHEMLGAGAQGPGKTLVLLMDPMQQIVVEHQRCNDPKHPFPLRPGTSTGWALHLRRTIRELEQTIVRSKRMFPMIDPGAKFDEQKSTWTFSSGYRFQFGHCQNPSDWQNYLGVEITHLAFDELVTFLEEQYDNICLRVRSSDPVLRTMLKIRSMSNPMVQRSSGENYAVDPTWVRRRFVDPAPEGGKLIEEKTKRASGEIIIRRRMYLRATLYDNPDKDFVAQEEAKLLFAKPHIKAAMLYGNWYITVGSFFGDDWNEQMHVIKPHHIPPEWPRWRSMDWGYKKPGCIHWWTMDPDGNAICIRELMFKGMTVKQLAKRIRDYEVKDGTWKGGRSIITGPADTQLWEKRGEEGLSKFEEFMRAGIIWVQADKKSRTRNAERISERLRDHENGTTLPGLMFFDTCKDIIKTLPGIQTTHDDPETPLDGGHDHSYDSCAYSVAFVSRGSNHIPRMSAGKGGENEDEDERDDDDEDERGNAWGYGSTV